MFMLIALIMYLGKINQNLKRFIAMKNFFKNVLYYVIIHILYKCPIAKDIL